MLWAVCEAMGRGKARFTIKQKCDIVDEAYAIQLNVKRTAKKYNVSGAEIRRWKKALGDRKALKDDGIMNNYNNRREFRVLQPEVYDYISVYFDQLRLQHVAVSVGDLALEALR